MECDARHSRAPDGTREMEQTTLTRSGDVLTVADLPPDSLAVLLDLAERMRSEPHAWCDAIRGETLALIFEKPSTRTRASFAAAAVRLGMAPLALRPDELQLGRGEPIGDTARVLSSYVAAIAIRTFAQTALEEFARAATVPVINALSDDHHPCQALADLLTIRQCFGRLGGLRIAYVGDGNNVAHSLLQAGALTGMDVVVASPAGYEPRADALADAERLARQNAGSVAVVRSPIDAVADAHVVYTDVWVSMGEDEERRRRRAALAPYRVDAGLLRHARPDAIFLHCLPAHRGEEVDANVIDGPRSRVWLQAANRMPTEQALLYALVTGDWLGSEVAA
jgi:ornithine carbamoyltransferase